MLCPFLKDECIKDKCMMWLHGVKKSPQTQEVFPYSNCSIAESSLMLLDIIKNTSGVQAAVESHRNENVVGQQELLNLLTTAQQRRLQMPNEG